MRVLVFDTETSGIPPKHLRNQISSQNVNMWPHIVQLSYVVYDTTTQSIETLEDTIVKIPNNVKLDGLSEKIHGITNQMSVIKGVDIEIVLRKFINKLVDVDQVVGHNLEFDLNMLRAECYRIMASTKRAHKFKKQYELMLSSLVTIPCYCTMQDNIERCNITCTSPAGKTYIKWPTLEELHNHLFEPVSCTLHNALVDVVVCLRCYCKLSFDTDIATTCHVSNNVLGLNI